MSSLTPCILPTQLSYASLDGMKAKIESLQKKGIDLLDHVATSKQEREEKKKQRRAEVMTVRDKQEETTDNKDKKTTADNKTKTVPKKNNTV